MELAKQIKFYREKNGLSQEKLAEKIYVSRQSISNWEKVMFIGMVLMPLSMGPAIQAERLKKKNNVQTYSEILAYMENKEVDKEKVQEEKRHSVRSNVFKMVASLCITLVLIGIGFIIFIL